MHDSALSTVLMAGIQPSFFLKFIVRACLIRQLSILPEALKPKISSNLIQGAMMHNAPLRCIRAHFSA